MALQTPMQVDGTVFSHIDKDKVGGSVDFEAFDAAFKMKPRLAPARQSTKKAADSGKVGSVLPPNRARNLSIATRRIGMNIDQVVIAIEEMDFTKVTPEKAELLRQNFMPSSDEADRIGRKLAAKEPVAVLDLLLHKLFSVPRVMSKLFIMMNVESASESLKTTEAGAQALLKTSCALQSSSGLKQLLEVILAHGNHMNGTRGQVLGFKLDVVDRLVDTRTTDRTATLMDFVVASVLDSEKPLDTQQFPGELGEQLEKAATVSLGSLQADLAQVRRIVERVKNELGVDPGNSQLKKVLKTLEPGCSAAAAAVTKATARIVATLKFFCEPSTTEPSTFFSVFGRLIKAYTLAKAKRSRSSGGGGARIISGNMQPQPQQQQSMKQQSLFDALALRTSAKDKTGDEYLKSQHESPCTKATKNSVGSFITPTDGVHSLRKMQTAPATGSSEGAQPGTNIVGAFGQRVRRQPPPQVLG